MLSKAINRLIDQFSSGGVIFVSVDNRLEVIFEIVGQLDIIENIKLTNSK